MTHQRHRGSLERVLREQVHVVRREGRHHEPARPDHGDRQREEHGTAPPAREHTVGTLGAVGTEAADGTRLAPAQHSEREHPRDHDGHVTGEQRPQTHRRRGRGEVDGQVELGPGRHRGIDHELEIDHGRARSQDSRAHEDGGGRREPGPGGHHTGEQDGGERECDE